MIQWQQVQDHTGDRRQVPVSGLLRRFTVQLALPVCLGFGLGWLSSPAKGDDYEADSSNFQRADESTIDSAADENATGQYATGQIDDVREIAANAVRDEDSLREARRDDDRRGFDGPRDGERRGGPGFGGPRDGGPQRAWRPPPAGPP